MAAAVFEPLKSHTEINSPPRAGEEPLFEVVNGQVVELPNMSSYSGQIANDLSIELAIYARQKKSGTVLTEILFSIPLKKDADNQRRPDVAYLAKERWPIGQRAPDSDPWPAVPNLAVEVLSPNDRI